MNWEFAENWHSVQIKDIQNPEKAPTNHILKSRVGKHHLFHTNPPRGRPMRIRYAHVQLLYKQKKISAHVSCCLIESFLFAYWRQGGFNGVDKIVTGSHFVQFVQNSSRLCFKCPTMLCSFKICIWRVRIFRIISLEKGLPSKKLLIPTKRSVKLLTSSPKRNIVTEQKTVLDAVICVCTC